MSRLYGRSYDVYNASCNLKYANLKHYKKDKRKTSWDELATCPEKIELYLPSSAIDIISNQPIRVVGSPLVLYEKSLLPKSEDDEPTLLFPRRKPIEEYKRELVFFLGTFLSMKSPDELPKVDDIACEYSDLLALLLEYLYLKESDKLDDFSIKHLNELLYNAKRYIKSYENFEKIRSKVREADMYIMNDTAVKTLDNYLVGKEQEFLKATLDSLVPLSSMDALLQITDEVKDTEEIKKLIEKLIENPDHNRQNILNDMGVSTFGYNRLIKEIGRNK